MGKEARKAGKVRRQVAALPFRVGEAGIEVLVLTSRGTGRWVLPKGWPMRGLEDGEAAAVEAREESGTLGKPSKRPMGSYRYWKRTEADFRLVEVDVYPLEARGQLSDWKERGERRMAWVPPRVAAMLVDEPGLTSLLEAFAEQAPKSVRKASRRMAPAAAEARAYA
jgi:8-oxo-dGTP pyrophosphatase MutT (NUDIX family)